MVGYFVSYIFVMLFYKVATLYYLFWNDYVY